MLSWASQRMGGNKRKPQHRTNKYINQRDRPIPDKDGRRNASSWTPKSALFIWVFFFLLQGLKDLEEFEGSVPRLTREDMLN